MDKKSDDKLFNDDIEQMRLNGIYTSANGRLFMPCKTGETAEEPVPDQDVASIFDEAQTAYNVNPYEGFNVK